MDPTLFLIYKNDDVNAIADNSVKYSQMTLSSTQHHHLHSTLKKKESLQTAIDR